MQFSDDRLSPWAIYFKSLATGGMSGRTPPPDKWHCAHRIHRSHRRISKRRLLLPPPPMTIRRISPIVVSSFLSLSMLRACLIGAHSSSPISSRSLFRIAPDEVLAISTNRRWLSSSVGRDPFPPARPMGCCAQCPGAGSCATILRPIWERMCPSRQM